MSSAYFGGWISDWLDPKYKVTRGFLCGICVLIAFPFVFLSFVLKLNFYVSMIFYAISYFFAEQWYGPCVSMFPQLFPSSVSGLTIAIFSFAGSMAGALINVILGVLGDKFDTENNPANAGYLLTGAVGISYIGCAIPFIVGGLLYSRFIRK